MAKKTFEQTLKALEKIVEELESGDLPLEKALQKFDEGMSLSRRCNTMLDETEQKVSQLLGEDASDDMESPLDIHRNGDS